MTLGFASLPNYFHVLGGIDINSTSLEAYKKNYSTPTLNIDIASIEPKSAIIANTFGLSGNKKSHWLSLDVRHAKDFLLTVKRITENLKIKGIH